MTKIFCQHKKSVSFNCEIKGNIDIQSNSSTLPCKSWMVHPWHVCWKWSSWPEHFVASGGLLFTWKWESRTEKSVLRRKEIGNRQLAWRWSICPINRDTNWDTNWDSRRQHICVMTHSMSDLEMRGNPFSLVVRQITWLWKILGSCLLPDVIFSFHRQT